jgi:DNA-binding SARP family transcriptional activator/pimeloyl-ACP methyl ester carboxylesterase
MPNELELDLLGSVRLRVDGEEQTLPSSRKTRALLAYLAVSAKPLRRERLCDLLWEMPDDPRGALRWSLSKLRALVDTTDHKRLKADRETVQLEIPEQSVDWLRLRKLVRSGPESASTDDLRRAAISGTFLEGLDLPGCEEFNAWCIACREDARAWRVSVLDELTGRSMDGEEAIEFARSWTMLDPFSAKPWERLVEILRHSERAHEAEQQRSLAIKMLTEAGSQVPMTLRTTGRVEPAPQPERAARRTAPAQKLRFCRSVDGTGLAYATIGEGPPLVRAGYWMNHLENDLTSPVWWPWIDAMSADHALLRYDARGFGLSDRNVNLNVELAADDLGAVVDAANLERFDLYGMAQGAVTALMYAARNPDRVRRLILQSSYALGWMRRNDPREIERRNATITLATSGWTNKALRKMFSGLYIPSGTDEQIQWFDEFFRSMMVHKNIEPVQRLLGEIDVRPLAEQVKAPTLVLHSRGEVAIPLSAGREVATLIPDARLVTLDTASHILVDSEPAWERMLEAVREFLS